MSTHHLFLFVALIALVIDQAAKDLVADVRLAMKRADLSLDYVARCTGVPPQRLSDQLNGKTPFTSFWRFITREIRETQFWPEFLALRAERSGGVMVRGELARLVRGVEQLVKQQEERKAS